MLGAGGVLAASGRVLAGILADRVGAPAAGLISFSISTAGVLSLLAMAGLIASQGLGVYNTSKYAVVGLSETLHKDLRPHDIGVSILCPMGVSTNIRTSERNRPRDLQNPKGPEDNDWFQLIGRYLEPEEVAGRVLRAVKANRLYVITHEEAREPLRRRFERMDKAFEESR